MKIRDQREKEREHQQSINIQRLMIRDMKEHGPGTFCMIDRETGTPLTYGQVFDLHARLMAVIEDVEARLDKENNTK